MLWRAIMLVLAMRMRAAELALSKAQCCCAHKNLLVILRNVCYDYRMTYPAQLTGKVGNHRGAWEV